MKGTSDKVIFLLGAGASKEAGMPLVKEFTINLRQKLSELSSDSQRYDQIFDLIAKGDPDTEKNYEKFFEYLYLLPKIQKKGFQNIITIQPEYNSLIETAARLCMEIGHEVKRLFQSYQKEAMHSLRYLQHFKDFLPRKGRLKIFTLNYDCCVEEACRNKIDITTGFDPKTGKWVPHLFDTEKQGINLYKLHGSLRWFRKDNILCELPFDQDLFTIRPEQIDLILGPGSKLQPDDPFLTLTYEFHRALQLSEVCAVIGYGFHDDYIKMMLQIAMDRGLRVLDVNRTHMWGCGHTRYHFLRETAETALENGSLDGKLNEIFS